MVRLLSDSDFWAGGLPAPLENPSCLLAAPVPDPARQETRRVERAKLLKEQREQELEFSLTRTGTSLVVSE